MKSYRLYIALISITYFSCGEENLNDIADNQFVVEAFIYAGEPIQDIRIKTVFPLADEDDTSTPINDAQVTILKKGERFSLIPSASEGYYHYPNSDLLVEINDVFDLEVTHNGITATAQTIVPTPTLGLRISTDSLKVPAVKLSEGREAIAAKLMEFMAGSSIEANWDNADEDLYYMVVEQVGDTLDPIFPDQVLEALSRFRFVSEPTDGTSLTFLGGTLVSFGTYVVKVYHINKEYADLYENRNQDSRDLNEPPSNVQNALGVFSAFNSDEVIFEVVRDSE